MARYILRRCAEGVITLLVMTVVVFLLVRLSGNPADALLSDYATQEDRERLIADLGLDQPLVLQYGIFMGNALRGDFGSSLKEQRAAWDVVFERLPASLELAVVAVLAGLLIGIPLGVCAAVYKDRWPDSSAKVSAMLGQSLPVFVTGLLLMWLFAVTLRWAPTSGRRGLDSYLLPSLALGWYMSAGILRLVRSAMLEVLHTDYVKLARIKGVPEWSVVWRHALRNALLPALTFFGLILANLMTGSVVVENLFAWPGAGRLAVTSVLARDYPVIQVIVLVFTAIFVVVNLAVDLLYAYLNPRIRYG